MYIIFKYSEGPSIGFIRNKEEAEEYAKLTNCYIEELKEIKRSDWPEQVTFISASLSFLNYHNNTPIFTFNEITVLDTEINMYKDELFYSKYHVTKNYFNMTKDEAEKEFRKTIEDEGFLIVKDINKSNCITKKSELENLVKKDVDGEECWAKLEQWAEKEKPKATTSGLFTSGGYAFTSTPYTVNRQPFELLGARDRYVNQVNAETWNTIVFGGTANRNNNVYINPETRTEILSWPTAQPIGTGTTNISLDDI